MRPGTTRIPLNRAGHGAVEVAVPHPGQAGPPTSTAPARDDYPPAVLLGPPPIEGSGCDRRSPARVLPRLRAPYARPDEGPCVPPGHDPAPGRREPRRRAVGAHTSPLRAACFLRTGIGLAVVARR